MSRQDESRHSTLDTVANNEWKRRHGEFQSVSSLIITGEYNSSRANNLFAVIVFIILLLIVVAALV